MKKNKIFLLIMMLATMTVSAQQSVNSSGGSFTGTGGSASISVGQIAYTALKSDSATITQGVQQVWVFQPQSVQKLKASSVQTVVYPNPVLDGLTLEITSGNPNDCKWIFSDLQGKIISNGEFENSRAYISAESFSSGTYILSISEKNQIIQSQKIIKK